MSNEYDVCYSDEHKSAIVVRYIIEEGSALPLLDHDEIRVKMDNRLGHRNLWSWTRTYNFRYKNVPMYPFDNGTQYPLNEINMVQMSNHEDWAKIVTEVSNIKSVQFSGAKVLVFIQFDKPTDTVSLWQ